MSSHPGLTTAQVDAARAAGQVNRSTVDAARSWRQIARANLVTRFNLLLGALGVVILVVGPLKDAQFLGVIAANAAIGIAQEWRATRTLEKLRLLAAPTVTVWRDGERREVPAEQLVVGDVVELSRGDQIPVDATVLESDALEIDTSLLTGEAEPVLARAGDPVTAGTIVVAGLGTVETTAVGADRVASRIEAEARRFDLAPSDLRRTTDRLLAVITWAIVIVGPLLVLRQAFGPESWRESVRGTVAGMVSMVPEGLVLLTSATLALGAIRLGRRRVLAQELPAIELLARVDTLCLDKTGTITTGEPSVTSVVVVGEGGEAAVDAALAALASVDPNPNLTLAAIRRRVPTPPDWTAAQVVPFSSARRWGGAAFGEHGTWVLGAPDVLAPGTELDAANEGNRVVALARVDGPLDPAQVPRATVVAHVVLAEQIRPTAPATLAYLDDQGVHLKVISGDLPATVGRVVAAAGRPEPRVADGRDAPADPAAVDRWVQDHDVVGRVEPHGKQQLVRAMQQAGHVVGMTGDGVNDVLALKEANLGIAMGSGAPAARAVAELVLLDDDFDVVPTIVDEGRRVLANVERVSVFFLTKTVWACLLAAVVTVSGMPYPLYASQATFIGFVTIGVPAFLLSFRTGAPRARPGIYDRIVRRALPAGVIVGVGAASVFAIVHEGFDHATKDARSATALAIVAATITVVALNLGPRPGHWRLLPGAMVALAVGVVAIGPFRRWFSLERPTATSTSVTLVAGVVMSAALVVVDRWSRARTTRTAGRST